MSRDGGSAFLNSFVEKAFELAKAQEERDRLAKKRAWDEKVAYVSDKAKTGFYKFIPTAVQCLAVLVLFALILTAISFIIHIQYVNSVKEDNFERYFEKCNKVMCDGYKGEKGEKGPQGEMGPPGVAFGSNWNTEKISDMEKIFKNE